MESSSSRFYNGNQHNDVLNAKPSSIEDKERLVEELKRRGNVAFKCGSYPEAIVLYSKAIEHIPSAALYSNRSMSNANIGHFKEALEDATQAIAVDGNWAKGYFRKANAEIGLHKYDDAKVSLKKVLELEASDQSAKKLLDSIDAKKAAHLKTVELENEKKKAVEDDKKLNRVVSKKVVEVNDTEKSPVKKNSSNGANKDDSMRGYKVLADGRKTTFFNRELSEADKKILGEIKHEKLDAPLEEEGTLENGASLWNKGGTFEEKNFSEWAHDRLKALLNDVKCPVQLKDSDGDQDIEDIVVKDIADLEGDASVTFTRGKKRHIFDFNFSVNWKVLCDGKTISGSIFFPDVSGDSVDDDIEFELRWSDRGQAGVNESVLAKTLSDTSAKGMAGRLIKSIQAFAAEFRSMI